MTTLLAILMLAGAITPKFVPEPKFCPAPIFLPVPSFIDPPVKAPTHSVPADAKGRWEVKRTCGAGGCSLEHVWVPAPEEPPPAIEEAAEEETCSPPRRFYLFRRWRR